MREQILFALSLLFLNDKTGFITMGIITSATYHLYIVFI